MGLKPEPFPGTVIDKPGDLGEPLVSDILKGRPFRKVLPEQAVGVLVRPTLRRSVGVTEGLIFKPCKCNNRQSFDNTKITAKQGNAEERPDAGCKIYGESSGRKVAAFLFTGIFQADKPRGLEGRALVSRQAASLSSKKIIN